MPFVVEDYIAPPGEGALLPGPVTGSIDFAMAHATPFEQSVLTVIWPLIRGRHRWVEVKIRCRHVEPDEPFMPMTAPHYDVTMNLERPERPEIHHLYTTPPGPVFYTVAPELRAIGVSPPDYHVVTYGRHALHQTPLARVAGPRLLIRATESDIVRPRNQVEKR
jgi:hypothetical protein